LHIEITTWHIFIFVFKTCFPEVRIKKKNFANVGSVSYENVGIKRCTEYYLEYRLTIQMYKRVVCWHSV